MALIGLRYCYAAPIKTLNTDGTAPTYGEGVHVGRMMTADETVNFGDNPLYADDRVVNNDTDFTDGTLTLGIDEFGKTKSDQLEIRAMLTGEKYVPGKEKEPNEINLGEVRTDTYVGIGFIKSGKYPDDTGRYYELTWYHRVKFKPGSESASTRGNSTTWQGKTLEGEIYTVPGMDSSKNIRSKMIFDDEAAALEKLKELANYTDAAESGTESGTESEDVRTETESYLGGSGEED